MLVFDFVCARFAVGGGILSWLAIRSCVAFCMCVRASSSDCLCSSAHSMLLLHVTSPSHMISATLASVSRHCSRRALTASTTATTAAAVVTQRCAVAARPRLAQLTSSPPALAPRNRAMSSASSSSSPSQPAPLPPLDRITEQNAFFFLCDIQETFRGKIMSVS